MRYDAELLQRVEQGSETSTLRFFRFSRPTVSYGRLQKLRDVTALVPTGWEVVQRPTGGGIVFHQDDFCFSLCWKAGSGPMSFRPQEQYRWIHSVVLDALNEEKRMRMAACCEAVPSGERFAVRTCFQNPVRYDLLRGQEKILGGALRCTRRATLYQGALQILISPKQEAHLRAAFSSRLNENR